MLDVRIHGLDRKVEQLPDYPQLTAGALIGANGAAVPLGTSLAETLEYLRTIAPTMETARTVYVVPVVDADGRLTGIVTADDGHRVEASHCENRGADAASDAAAIDRHSPTRIAILRLPWLLGTMAIELCAGAIIARFDAVLREVILLASFMPVISAVSGNVGLQAAAIVVRGLDTGHVSVDQWIRALRRELIFGKENEKERQR